MALVADIDRRLRPAELADIEKRILTAGIVAGNTRREATRRRSARETEQWVSRLIPNAVRPSVGLPYPVVPLTDLGRMGTAAHWTMEPASGQDSAPLPHHAVDSSVVSSRLYGAGVAIVDLSEMPSMT